MIVTIVTHFRPPYPSLPILPGRPSPLIPFKLFYKIKYNENYLSI